MNILVVGVTNPAGFELTSLLSSQEYNVHYLHYRKIFITITEFDEMLRYDFVVSVIPIWHLAELLKVNKVRFDKLISLSSTSLMTKKYSDLPNDQTLVENFKAGEASLTELCIETGAQSLFLRTTMLWGNGYDNNISSLIRFSRKYHFLPYFPPSLGSRSPIHYIFLAKAIVHIIHSFASYDRLLILKGNSSFTLKQMLKFICFKYNAFLIPLFLPVSIITNLNLIFKSSFLDKLVGFASRSNQNLDEFDTSENIYVVDQPFFIDLL